MSDPTDPSESTELDELTDELPDDLDRHFETPYEFPDNKRRRVPGLLYIGLGLLTVLIVVLSGDRAVLTNTGLVVGAVGLMVIGLYHLFAALPLLFNENDALVAATRSVGFPVGHASAQLGWRGLRSRPTWKILLYSAEDPPDSRGLVLIDAVTGDAVDQLVETNPEDWTNLARADGSGPTDEQPDSQLP